MTVFFSILFPKEFSPTSYHLHVVLHVRDTDTEPSSSVTLYGGQSVIPPNMLPLIVILLTSTVLPANLNIHASQSGVNFIMQFLPLLHLPCMLHFSPIMISFLQPHPSSHHHQSMLSSPLNYLPPLPTPPCRSGLNQLPTMLPPPPLTFIFSFLPVLIPPPQLPRILSLKTRRFQKN